MRVVGYDDTLMGWTDPSLYELHSGEFLIVAAHEPEVSFSFPERRTRSSCRVIRTADK